MKGADGGQTSSLWEEVGVTRWMHFGVIALLLKGVQQYNARQSITSNGTVQSHMEKVATCLLMMPRPWLSCFLKANVSQKPSTSLSEMFTIQANALS